MKTLEGKIAVVTGGSGVLGSNISKGLLQAGAAVFIVGGHQHKVDAAVEALSKEGQVEGKVCDVLSKDAVDALAAEVLERYGHIDILVNCAGGNVAGANIMENQNVWDMKDEDLRKVIDLNLYGTIYPCLAFAKIMAGQKYGSIVNISSMAAYDSLTRVMGYSVAKTGVIALTKWLAQEMAIKYSEKIRVNAVAPGFFIGEQNRAALLNPDGSLTERSHKVHAKTPMRRFGDISEVNGAVVFLCSDEASFITGTILPVDGGFSSFSGV